MTLWTAAEVAAATGGTATGAFDATGVTFDSREVMPGDLFVALDGGNTDGHRFVDGAFAAGAAGAIVARGDAGGPVVRVSDTTAALDALARAARARTAARIVGVTGSVGKTGTKEALADALERAAPGAVHRSVRSYNNHTGVPLSLARMPAETRFGVFEMGMNHAGELAGLTRIVRPHVALVTAIAPAHTAHFSGVEAIADAKGEIFQGLEPGGVAVVPFDSAHRDRLIAAARDHAGRIVTFGSGAGADVRALDTMRVAGGGTFVHAQVGRRMLAFTVAQAGDHWVSNALAVLAAVDAVGGDLGLAGLALGDMAGLAGRGERSAAPVAGGGAASVIDESYNANPASMRATLAVLAREGGRRIAVLGGMRELGEDSAAYHAALAAPIAEAGVAYAVLVGPEMAPLADALEGRTDFRHVGTAAEALDAVRGLIAAGDTVLVKGSNGIGLRAVVAGLVSRQGVAD